MRVESFGLKDMFAFDGAVLLDVKSVGAGLIAIVGENGVGKTGLMEIVPGVNWGKLPGRENDPPVDYATSRQAWLEYVFQLDDQSRYRALLSMDGDSRASDGLLELLLPDGKKVPFNDGKVSTFRKAIAELGFPSFDLFINSNFAAQGRGDEFVRTKQSARKDLFAQFLGLSVLLTYAKTAAAAADACQAVAERLAFGMGVLKEETSPTVTDSLDARERQHREAEAKTATRRTELAGIVGDLEARLATMQDAVAAHGAATLRIRTLQGDLQSRLNEQAQLQRESKSANETLATDTAAAAATWNASLKTIDDKLAALDSNPTLAQQLADIDELIENNRTLQADGAAVRKAATEVAAADQELGRLRKDLDEQQAESSTIAIDLRAAEQALAELRPVEQKHDYAMRDAALLEKVPCNGEAPYDSCQFLKNATAGKAQLQQLVEQLQPKADLAERVGRLLKEKTDCARSIDRTRTAIGQCESKKAIHTSKAQLLPMLEASANRIKELEKTRQSTVAAAAEATEKARQDLQLQRAAAQATFTTATAAAQRRRDQTHFDLGAREQALADRIAAIQKDLAGAEADLAAVAVGNNAAAQLRIELDRARNETEAVLQSHTRAVAGLQELARERAAVEEKRTKLALLERRLAVVNQALIEWRSLHKDLGKGGLADLEIDAAGPTISDTANALLTASYSARFSLKLITQSEKVDGGMKDDFDVLVMDNEDGKGWRPIRTFSGGQRTIIQEALMLAIALYVNERSPMPIRTLWRDETGAALDRDNAPRYVEMLRKAREIGNFHQVLFITHNETCAQMADAQIQVGKGTARIVLPPFASLEQEAAA